MSSKRIYQHFIKRTAAEGKSIVAWDNNRRYEGVFRSFDPTGEFVILSDVWVSESEETIFVSEMLLPLDSLTIVSAGLPVSEEEVPPKVSVPEVKEAPPQVEEKPSPTLSPEKEEAFREVMEKKEEVPEVTKAEVTPLKEEAKEEKKEEEVQTLEEKEEEKKAPPKEELTQPFTIPEKKPSRLSGLKKIFRRGEKKPPKEALAPPVPPTPAAAKKEERSTVGWARRVPRFPTRAGKPPVPPQVIQRKSAEVSASNFFSQENLETPTVPSRRIDIGTLILDILIGILVLVAIAIVIMGFLKVKLPLPF
jgi:hypothetical protein